jgi:hypothetical protein
MIDHAAAAINAIRQLGATGLSGGKPVLLVGGEDDRAATLAAMSVISGVPPINLNAELAQAMIDAAGTRVDPASLIAGFNPETTPLLLDRIQILMLPQLKVDALDVLTRVARRRAVCASWPGRLENGRLRYANHNHPECFDDDAARALIIDLTTNESQSR